MAMMSQGMMLQTNDNKFHYHKSLTLSQMSKTPPLLQNKNQSNGHNHDDTRKFAYSPIGIQKSSISSLSNHPPLALALTSVPPPSPSSASSFSSFPPMVSPSSFSPSNAPEPETARAKLRLENRRCVLGGSDSRAPGLDEPKGKQKQKCCRVRDGNKRIVLNKPSEGLP
jgi:hypothetical protein